MPAAAVVKIKRTLACKIKDTLTTIKNASDHTNLEIFFFEMFIKVHERLIHANPGNQGYTGEGVRCSSLPRTLLNPYSKRGAT